MSEDEKMAVMMRVIALSKAGKEEEASALNRTVPMPPFLAKFAKEHGHLDFLIESGWNMAEAEAVFGPGWLAP
jgi:hypothetical protein